jgi:hypothetical protein
MIELRWVEFGPNKQLEYRILRPMGVENSGWSDWRIVPTVSGDEAAFEDLVAFGGIADAHNGPS